jgi:hypothetical protein
MSLRPPPEGWHEVERNPDGTLKGRLPKDYQEKREAKLKSDMERYQARTRANHEKLLKSASGIKEEPETHAPKDELDLVMMNFLAAPDLLQGKGAVPLQVLTEDQQRARRRQDLDAQAAKARKHLDKVLKGDDEDRDSYEALSASEADALIDGQDDDWEEHLGWLFEDDNETEKE